MAVLDVCLLTRDGPYDVQRADFRLQDDLTILNVNEVKFRQCLLPREMRATGIWIEEGAVWLRGAWQPFALGRPLTMEHGDVLHFQPGAVVFSYTAINGRPLNEPVCGPYLTLQRDIDDVVRLAEESA